MEQNKTGKYIKYAIGEIILVVIGILIALQINTWNEARKDRHKEQSILMQLEEEYISNLAQLEDKMQMRHQIVASGQALLAHIDAANLANIDTVITHLSNIVYDPTFDPIENDLIGSGNIRLISNNKLRNLLSNWSSDVIAVQESEQNNRLHVHEIILPFFNKLGVTRDVFSIIWRNWETNSFWLLDDNSKIKSLNLGNSKIDLSARDLLETKELEGIITNAISLNYVGNLESESLKMRINDILELIRMEINK